MKQEHKPTIPEDKLSTAGLRFAVIVSRFNDFITTRLLEGCLDTLHHYGADDESIEVIWCPGAFEIPLVAMQAALTTDFDAVICLGAVIRGATPHFDHVAGQAANGIAQVGLETGIPTIFGVLTTDSVEQAMERSDSKSDNKGSDAACAAIEMANLLHELQSRQPTSIDYERG